MRLLAWAVAVLLTGPLFAAPLTIVRDGQPQAVIALPASQPTADDKAAATELQRYLERSTGAKLPIVSEAEAKLPALLLGLTAAANRLGLPDPSLVRGGFVIQTVPEGLVLSGASPISTRFAAYYLLEHLVGCRWYLSSDLFEIVPKHRQLVIPDMKLRQVPALEPRMYGYLGHGAKCSYVGEKDPVYGVDIWGARNLLSVDSRGRFQNYHNMSGLFPPALYDTHPEVFPLRDGKRYRVPNETPADWQTCFSSPAAVDVAVAAALEWFAKHPQWSEVSLAVNDGQSGYCECDKCKVANGPLRVYRGRPQYGNVYYQFVNAVAKRLAQEAPGKTVGLIAYMNVEEPPDFALEPNINVWLYQDVAQDFNRDYEQADHDLLARWTKVCRNLYRSQYYGIGWLLPRYYPLELARDARFMRQHGVRGTYGEDTGIPYLFGPMMWINARLMWDPSVDPLALQKQFCSDCFGKAAPEMDRMFTLWQKAWDTPRTGSFMGGRDDIKSQLTIFPAATVRHVRDLLDQAAARADTDLARQRVEFFRRGWRLCEQYAAERDLIAGFATLPSTEAGLLQAADRSLELPKLVEQRHEYAKELMQDPFLGGALEWTVVGIERSATWESYVQSAGGQLGGAVTTAVAAMAASSANRDGVWQRFTAHAAGTPLAAIARAGRALAQGAVTNLVQNPGFEEARAAAGATMPDWSAAGAPAGWSFWPAEGGGEFLWEPTGGHAGPRCVRLRGATGSCFIQTVPLKPGRQYLFSAWLRTDQSDPAKTYVRLAWQGEKGWIRWNENLLLYAQPAQSKWQQLFTVFTAPPDAVRVVSMLSARDHAPGQSTWYDDIVVAEAE